MVYFIRDALDVPHILSDRFSGHSVCGESMRGARQVSDLQLIVYYGGTCCSDCDPKLRQLGEAARLATIARRNNREGAR